MHGGMTGWCLQTWLAAALLHVLTAPEPPGRLGDVGVPGYFGGVDQACVSAGAPEAACNTPPSFSFGKDEDASLHPLRFPIVE